MSASGFLSKSLFLRGLQCYKSLYLHKYHPELQDEVTPAQEALFQSGYNVGRYAQNLFPGGNEILFESVPLSQQLRRTVHEIRKGVKTLYEPAFQYDGVLVKVDILHQGEQGWEIYEVKNSTAVENAHVDDVAVQYYVLNGTGLQLTRASLLHINRDYIRSGDIEVSKLFASQDLTSTILQKQDSIRGRINQMRQMLQGELPEIDIGPQCSDPYDCDFKGYCWQHIPEDSIFSIRGRFPNKFDLYRQGIIHLQDVPREVLSRSQLIQVEGTLGQKDVINRDGIRGFLNTLWYPLCFLDFETTAMVPIPLFDGMRPYQPLPFQYSLYVLDHKNAEPKHFEYLAPPKIDPRRPFLESLLERIPEGACVLGYNKTYEEGRLSDLKSWFPEFSDRIDAITQNLRDLMIPFQRKDYYRWQMRGSYSLKEVLPALVPELTYEKMGISDGQMASSAYLRIWKLEDKAEVEKIRQALLKYCKLDTLGMVRILEKLITMMEKTLNVI